jgi:CHAT domain-containing protein
LLFAYWSLVTAFTDDAADLQAVVDKFFAAYAEEDLDGFMALWSQKSPEFASRKQAMQQLFAANNYTFANLALSRVKVEGEAASLTASLRVAVDMTSQSTTQPPNHPTTRRLIRNFTFVKEGGAWKVWRYYPAADDLAAALVAAKTEEERKTLLAAEKELVTAELRDALHRLGHAHERGGKYALALKAWTEWRRLAEEVGDKGGVAEALNDIGNVHNSQGNYALALEFYQKSLKMSEELGNKAGIARTLNNIAHLYEKQDNTAQALEFYQKGLTLAEAIGAPGTTYRCYGAIGRIHHAQGRTQDALAAYQKAIEHFERIRVAGGEEERLTFLHTKPGGDIYDGLVSLLVAQGKTAEALQYLERAKSKQLLDGIRLRSLTVRDDNLRALLQKTEQLEQALAAQEKQRLDEISKPDGQQNPTKLANLSRSIASTRAELLQVTNRIRDANPDYERFITVKATDLRRIQKALPPDVVVVQYLPLDTALLIFVVTREGEQVRSVAVSRQRIDELVSAFHVQMKLAQRQGGANVRDWDWNSDRAKRLREALTALYGYLIAPIQKDIASAETVVIVPSGTLYYLPFQALAREEPNGRVGERESGRQGEVSRSPTRPFSHSLRFFVEEKRLAVLTSLDLWGQITDAEREGKAPAAPARLSAFGNPDGTLPEAEQEVKRIGGLFAGSLVYVGAEATRQKLESLPDDVRMAHLATHGALNERDISECYLTLANGDKLKLGELYGFAGKYPAKLTVLSACETAMGRKDPGNEVAHLANGFVEAGSVTIVASLWQVADASTAVLMERFYKELKAGKSKAEAKRQAEMSLLRNKETAHPCFWSPFVLIGEWR